jgi:hypothetical protein
MNRGVRRAILAAVLSMAGCADAGQVALDGESAALVSGRSAVDEYGLSWLKSDADPAVIRAELFIAAPVEVVWSLVRDPANYDTFNKALTADIDVVEVGAPIRLFIRMFGDALPATSSDEMVELFDEELHVASWIRDFGGGQMSHRPQLLEAEQGGTHYYTALKLPPAIAWLVKPLLGNHIKAAFERFALGLRDESLRRAAAQGH